MRFKIEIYVDGEYWVASGGGMVVQSKNPADVLVLLSQAWLGQVQVELGSSGPAALPLEIDNGIRRFYGYKLRSE